jgi:hypothetical protein
LQGPLAAVAIEATNGWSCLPGQRGSSEAESQYSVRLLIATAAIFSTAHIATTALITGGVALLAGLLVLGRRRGLAESVVIAILAAGAVFLWRKSANMPQLNNDGLSPFSANDWLAPTLTYVLLGMYAAVRRPSNERRFAQARALAVLAAFIVNVVTI